MGRSTPGHLTAAQQRQDFLTAAQRWPCIYKANKMLQHCAFTDNVPMLNRTNIQFNSNVIKSFVSELSETVLQWLAINGSCVRHWIRQVYHQVYDSSSLEPAFYFADRVPGACSRGVARAGPGLLDDGRMSSSKSVITDRRAIGTQCVISCFRR